MNSVIQIAGVAKEYQLGRRVQSQTFREMLLNGMRACLPGSKQVDHEHKNAQESFWALRDVSFDVQQGEVVGVIGRNGAGKSTLLKILSRITEPTRGRVVIRGRLSSLLEVGTGFHPELTGRENIYLNGAILGMRQREIERKFDEIVAFAEVESFIDTPVKRYSSGMQVRLAFSVAAHLEPEIMVVDEVLAVGDASFQRKCMGKMEGVASSGRTILFVSHNMAAVRNLCSRGVVLSAGQAVFAGPIDAALDFYLKDDQLGDARISWTSQNAPQCSEVRLCGAYIEGADGAPVSILGVEESFTIVLEYELLAPVMGMRTAFIMQNEQGVVVCGSTDYDALKDGVRIPGRYVSRCAFPAHLLNSGRFSLLFGVDRPPYITQMIKTPYCLSFEVTDTQGHGPNNQRLPGVMKPRFSWDVRPVGPD